MRRRRFLVALDYRVFRGLAFAWMAFIFYLSSQPSLHVPPVMVGQDKVMHFITYAVLGFFAARAVGPVRGAMSWRRVAVAAMCALLYGVSDEFHQSFVPGRSPSVFDLLADGLGGWAGAWFARYLSTKLPHRGVRDELR